MYDKDFLQMLTTEYPTEQSVVSEIIKLSAIQSLPKGTEHFISDLHGEYETFNHILNNCSGVIREKVGLLFKDRYDETQLSNICTLIYYPQEKLNRLKEIGVVCDDWYKTMLNDLVELAKLLSGKYSRPYVRRTIRKEFGNIIDELMHVQFNEDGNRQSYHSKIIKSIIETKSAEQFLIEICKLIKVLAVDRLHIVGDIYDRGPHAERIMDVLLDYHRLDITWGNHDILWMGAAAGSEICLASVLRINISHNNLSILESGYGISLRELSFFAEKTYKLDDSISPINKAISVILFKLEAQTVLRHPEYGMNDRLLLSKIDTEKKQIEIDGKIFDLKTADFPTVNKENPFELTEEESTVLRHLKKAFLNSARLQQHMRLMYEKGSIYCIYNQNLIYHGCVPLDNCGNFDTVFIGGKELKGKAFLDFLDSAVRKPDKDLDLMWYLWCGKKSPLSGRAMKTFERTFIDDKSSWIEEKNPYYDFYEREEVCNMILNEFGLPSGVSHIINGHTPVIVKKGENPVKASGKLIVIDGGFCRAYHHTTGIAGYTLISNSHGLRIKAHRPFENIDKVLNDNSDINFVSTVVEQFKERLLIESTDEGKLIKKRIDFLTQLLNAYRNGELKGKS